MTTPITKIIKKEIQIIRDTTLTPMLKRERKIMLSPTKQQMNVSVTNSEINQIEGVFVLQDHEKPKQINTEVRGNPSPLHSHPRC